MTCKSHEFILIEHPQTYRHFEEIFIYGKYSSLIMVIQVDVSSPGHDLASRNR